MAALTPSLAPSLASAYAPNKAWLQSDSTADALGNGPVSTGDGAVFSNPRAGTAPVDLNPSPLPDGSAAPEFAEQAPDYFAESAFPHDGPWTPLPEKSDGKEAFGTPPDDGITPIGYYKIPPSIVGLAQWKQPHEGQITLDGQATDNEGWHVYAPSNRTAVRQGWVHKYFGVNPMWPVTQPNLAKSKGQSSANQMVHGVVAQYGDLANSGGNQAYVPPTPPAVSTTQAPDAASTVPNWGF